jgi:hypothetical protein
MEESHEIKYITSKNNVPETHGPQLKRETMPLCQHGSRNSTGISSKASTTIFSTDYGIEKRSFKPIINCTKRYLKSKTITVTGLGDP